MRALPWARCPLLADGLQTPNGQSSIYGCMGYGMCVQQQLFISLLRSDCNVHRSFLCMICMFFKYKLCVAGGTTIMIRTLPYRQALNVAFRQL